MARRLVKIAKELNVGTTTIVDHLISTGFEIENKPTAKITDEMYDELVREFQNSMVVKEQADQLIIGTRPVVKKEVVEAPMPVFKEKAKVEAPSVLEEKPEAVEETIDNREEAKAEIKVVGKIDLEKAAKAKKTKKEEAKVEPEPVEEDEAAPEPTEEKEELVRAETPQLQGLKILGKIDTEKFDREKKKREEEEKAKEKEKEAAKAKKKEEEEKRRKRRRRRTKVKATNVGDTQTDRSRRGKKTEEVKEVSQKEIDEKIRATMARLSGGRQKKRQKIRRDKRETMREKQELEQIEKESKAITLTEFVTAQELANLMDVSVTDIITTCMNLGVIVSINQRLDAEIIELLAEEFGHEVEFISAEEDKDEEEEIV